MAVACVAATLLAPAAASAGTFDVVACNAPGAGGVNHSLTSFVGSFDPARQAEANRSYELDGSCAGGLIARSHPLHTTAPWLTDAGWRFDAPAGTEITRVVSWRFGEARDFGDDPTTPFVDEGDHWTIALTDGTGQFVGGPAGGETCGHGLGVPACTIGEPNGGRSQHDVRTNALRWAVSCGGEIVAGCPTSYADPITAPGYPLATVALYGTAITLSDPSAPAATLSGPLFADGWHRPADGASYGATDNTGIRSAELTVGPAVARDPRACDYTYRVPCGNAADRPLTLESAPPDGVYTARLTVTDASGNAASVEKPVSIDGTAPSVSLKRPQRGSIIVGVTDWFSGLAAGQIQVRNRASEPYRPLATEYRKGALRAKLDRGNLQRADVWVSVRDNAGNEAAGTPSRFTLTSVSSGGRRKRVSKGQVRVRFGRTARVRGRLGYATGRPLAGIPVSITSAPGSGGVPVPEGSAQTNASGRFAITVPKGTARMLTIASPGAPGSLRTERRLRLSVPASSSIRASRTRLSGAGTVRFSGRVRGGRPGLIVVLQGREGGNWRTFADARTRAGGRWSASYRFRGRGGTYGIRARIRKQAQLPYDAGASRVLRVRVG